jgi:2-keto-myo-inositol isomerase
VGEKGMSNPVALGLGGLPGTLDQRLEAIRAAGFEAVEVDATDLARSSFSIPESVAHIRASGLRVTALKELRDFTGHVGHVMGYRMELAKTSLAMMAELGCKLVIVNPSATNKTTHVSELVEQLRALATLAMKRGIRVGYRPLPWSDHAFDFASAWRLIEQAGNSNLGLVVDSFQNLTDLDISTVFQQVPAEKVSLVRLSDFKMSALHVLEDKIEVDNHQRFFPGAGNLSGDLAQLVRQCHSRGYSGDIVLGVNDESYRMAGLDSSMKAAVKVRNWLQGLQG